MIAMEDVRRLPARVPVNIGLEAQFNADLRGRRVRLLTNEGQWDDDVWYVYGKGVETDTKGLPFIEVLPASEYWRLVHTRQVDVTLVERWPANSVYLD